MTNGKTVVSSYLNAGTFLKRNGKWQVVNWQSTRMPRAEEDSKKEVAAAQAAFHQALLVADAKALEDLADDTFIWTHRTGEQQERQELVEQLKSGKLKYSRMTTERVAVSIYGDTAVVRGVSERQRSAIPGSGTGDASPFTTFYTLTFVNRGGDWKAVAMHTSRT
jgi:ketosteroid isomerase-like protein